MIPQVVDWLLANIPALPECAGVLVSDGYPVEQVQTLVVVGSTDQNGVTASGLTMYAGIGPLNMETTGEVHLEVHAVTGDMGAQKTVRDTVSQIGDAIRNLIRSDPTLGGLVRPFPVLVTQVELSQTMQTSPAPLRAAVLHLVVQVRYRD